MLFELKQKILLKNSLLLGEEALDPPGDEAMAGDEGESRDYGRTSLTHHAQTPPRLRGGQVV